MMLSEIIRTVHAQSVSNTIDPPDVAISSLPELFGFIINVILGIGIALTVIYLIWAGIQYVTSKGDSTAVEEAQGALTNAIIGFIIIIGAFAIKNVVLNALVTGENADVVEGVTPVEDDST